MWCVFWISWNNDRTRTRKANPFPQPLPRGPTCTSSHLFALQHTLHIAFVAPSIFKAPSAGAMTSGSAAVAEPVCPSTSRRSVMTMAKKSVGSLADADLKGKRVFVRCDLNVPLDGKTITDDTRIRASVPTIEYLASKGAKVLLTSHLGRPKGKEDKFSLSPVADRLTELLGKKVAFVEDCIGEAVSTAVAGLKEGDVALLENVRFYPEEEKNVAEFAEKLAANADLYVNDAFGTAHRAHGSTEGVAKFLKPAVAGFLLQKELDYLDGAVSQPKRPFAAIVGGSKVGACSRGGERKGGEGRLAGVSRV